MSGSTASGVSAAVEALFALQLTGGQQQTISLGDVAPGEQASVVLHGTVDLGLSSEPWIALAVRVYDSAHPTGGQPADWLWAHQPVDRSAPLFFGINQPSFLLRAGDNALRGYAYDPAGAPDIGFDVQAPGGGVSTLDCPDSTPANGVWSCGWSLSASHGDVYQLKMHAGDAYGQTGNWSDWLPFRVDTQPPTVTIDYAASQVAPGGVVRGGSVLVVGAIADNAVDDGGIGGVTACTNGLNCRPAELADNRPAAQWPTNTCPPGQRRVGGCASPIVSTFVVTESFPIAEVQVGFRAEALHRDLLQVDLTGPDGRTVRLLDDDGRSGTDSRNYDVNLFDAAALSVSDLLDNQALGTALYSQNARPVEPLRAFAGANSAGTWTLSLCDSSGGTAEAAYIRSRLALTAAPQRRAGQRLALPHG